MKSSEKYFEGVGRRKTSTARVRLFKGDSVSTINKKPYEDYLAKNVEFLRGVLAPLQGTDLLGKYYFTATTRGGGLSGQVGAISLGIARALCEIDPTLKPTLRTLGLMTRDPRMVERKKYYHIKARKKPQYSKR